VQTAFVLSGGGVPGAHEVGMLRALSEAGITPDVVVGTSVRRRSRMRDGQLVIRDYADMGRPAAV
jgi:predicted ATPase